MEEKKMLKVTVDGKAYSYPYGTPYRAIAADFQDQSPWDILLVNREGKLCELHKVLDRDCTLKMVTAREKPGIQTYERSAVFLMLKAFYDVAGRENVERLSVEYSLSSALFILAKGSFTLDQDLLDRVEARMRELSAAAVPIEKRSISTDDAVELFRQNRMPHKAHLLSFRINSRCRTSTPWTALWTTSMAIWLRIPAMSNALAWSCLKTALYCACPPRRTPTS